MIGLFHGEVEKSENRLSIELLKLSWNGLWYATCLEGSVPDVPGATLLVKLLAIVFTPDASPVPAVLPFPNENVFEL